MAYTLRLFCFSIFIGLLASANLDAQEADSPAKLISAPEFLLPPEASAAEIDGKVRVDLTVKKTGETADVKVMAGIIWPCNTNPKDEIAQAKKAIVQNVEAAKFSPQIKDGKPVDSDLSLTFFVGRLYREEIKRMATNEALQSSKPRPKIIEGGVVSGKARLLPKPLYPNAAKAQRVSGAVSVHVLIDEEGNVASAGAISGHPIFHQSAREAACDARFAPTSLQGTPVKVSGVVTYNFVAPQPRSM